MRPKYKYPAKNDASNEFLGLTEHKCEMCGKEFECRKEYAYKIRKKNGGDRYYYYCSYSCYSKATDEYYATPHGVRRKIMYE